MTISPITAYRIELMAGLTFSSFPHERISMTHHQTMKSTAQITATRTTMATHVVIMFPVE